MEEKSCKLFEKISMLSKSASDKQVDTAPEKTTSTETQSKQQQQEGPIKKSLSFTDQHEGSQAGGGRPSQLAKRSRLATLAQIGEDWLYLALLGIIMALLSFSMDAVITLFLNTRLRLFRDVSQDSLIVQYLGWCVTPIVLVTFSSGFVHLCSPTAIGSGIPEMKTILRGVILNEYLTFRTLIAKIVGLTFTLGSGLPLGKEGPFVHMASIVATLLSKLVASFQGIYENESRTSEMLSAACAVGVAATFYAPIGGVLFSIEVTTVYFAVRNYWRGFFAACCGATIWRLLGFWIKNDESITALFKTNFRTDYPFDPVELLMFIFIGASSGLAGAGYIKFHRVIVQFFRRHKRLSEYFQEHRFVYPIMVTLIITTVTFPPFIGKYTASTLSTHTTIEHLFSNRTWSLGNQDLISKKILDQWTTPDTSFHLHLVLYILMLFWTSAVASTIPIPSGLFIPVIKMGAAYGRLIGELMHSTFPDGIAFGDYVHSSSIVPGSYAVVGAAAFSGAVTHTISTSVILFEMTGQIVHIIPVILGVLVANAVCQSLQPSIYDSIIEMKKLPYLPPIASSNSVSHKILVKDFMNTNLAYVSKEKFSYAKLKYLLIKHKKLISFPLVESPDSMKLLGSVPRPDLLKLLYTHLGRERRLQEVYRRNSDVVAPIFATVNQNPNNAGANQTNNNRARLEKFYQNESKRRPSIDSPSSSSANDDSGGKEKGNEAETGKFFIVTDPETNFNQLVLGKDQTGPRKLLLKLKDDVSFGDKEIMKELVKDKQISETANDSPMANNKDSNSNIREANERRIAKIINHYDRGSSIDEELLEKFERDLSKPRELRVEALVEPEVVESSENKRRKSDEGAARGKDSIVVNIEITPASDDKLPAMVAASPATKLRKFGTTKALSPLIELKQTASFELNPSQLMQQSPSLRPKSILKTSSTSESLNKMYTRNISIQDISSSSFGDAKKNDQDGTTTRARFTNYLDNQLNAANGGAVANFTLGDEANDSPGATPPATIRQRRRVRLPKLRVVDMTPEEQEQWEADQLNALIDISKCQIDEAPFQLVQQTSLYRVHTLFSMLGLNHAYVTSYGTLVGVVALKDIRYAIEEMMLQNS